MALWSYGDVKPYMFITSKEDFKPLTHHQLTDDESWKFCVSNKICCQGQDAFTWQCKEETLCPLPRPRNIRTVGRLRELKATTGVPAWEVGRRLLISGIEEPSKTFILFFAGLNFLQPEPPRYKIPAEVYVFTPRYIYIWIWFKQSKICHGTLNEYDKYVVVHWMNTMSKILLNMSWFMSFYPKPVSLPAANALKLTRE